MNLGAFFAAMLALGSSEPIFSAERPGNQPQNVAQTALVAPPVQLAALPPDSDPATTPPAPPPPTPKAKPARTATKQGQSTATKPGSTTAPRKPAPPRKTTTAAKPSSNGNGKTKSAAACPTGTVKSPSTGRCTPRVKPAAPEA
jgi:hypothetical protein